MPSARTKRKLLWNSQSSRHHCHRHRHCHCITAAAIKGYLPPRLVPSSHRHRLTDTSSVYRRYSHRRIARRILPPSARHRSCRQRREWCRRSEYVHGRRHGKCSYQSADYRHVPFASTSCRTQQVKMNPRRAHLIRPTSAKTRQPSVNERRRRRLPLAPPTQRNKSHRAEKPPQRNNKNVPHRLLVLMPVRPHLLHRVFSSLLRRNKKN